MGQGRSCRKAKAVDLCWTTLLCGMVWANSGSPAFAGKLRSNEMRVPVVTRPVPDPRPDVTSARALTDAFESDAYMSAKAPALSTGTASTANRPVIAVDIDETLSKTDYTGLLWGIGGDNITPLPGAQATLRRPLQSSS